MNAYNYETQQWVTGVEARRVRFGQLVEELSILHGPRAEEYLRFSGSKLTRREACIACSKEMELLESM